MRHRDHVSRYNLPIDPKLEHARNVQKCMRMQTFYSMFDLQGHKILIFGVYYPHPHPLNCPSRRLNTSHQDVPEICLKPGKTQAKRIQNCWER